MTHYEYKVVPATNRGLKAKGTKGAEARFALALEVQINAQAAEGWEYQRAEMLPSQERAGLTGTSTQWRHVLIFRRPTAATLGSLEPELLPPPEVSILEIETEDGDALTYEDEQAAGR